MVKASHLVGVLCLAPLAVTGQTTVDIASCDDLPSSITTDTVLQFTASEISCSTNTHVMVSSGAAVEITSAEASTKLNNVKFDLDARASFLSNVPQLDWTSVETEPETSIFEASGGAAMRINGGCSATFSQDVTFSGCSLPEGNTGGASGAAIANFGTLLFKGTATFKDTLDGGALYTYGDISFEGDAIFENNKHNNYGDGNGSGAGLYIGDEGWVEFKGAASFIDNEVTETFQSGGRGAGMFSSSFMEEPLVFSGPVLFKGNSGLQGALALFGEQTVIFESLVTFEDNVMEPKTEDASSIGGAMWVTSYNNVEFQAGVTATGNSARTGGVFYFDEIVEITIAGPVTITGNEAEYAGGAIWSRATTLTLPADADISGNSALWCPGILSDEGDVVFTGGATYTDGSKELCYLGASTDSTPTDIVEDFDCEAYAETAPTTNDYPYLVLDTREVKTWNLGTSVTGGFSCPEQLIVYVTGGEELTVVSTALSAVMENVRFEVISYTKLVLDMPDLTMTGIFQSQLGGAVFIDSGSSMEVMDKITFMGNTLAYENLGSWVERGGAAMYSAGDVTFYENAYFLGNGQYPADADGYEPSNEPGGAISNSGTMEFMKKGTFNDNFNPNGGDGGAVANFGDLTFNLRSVFRNNSVGEAYTDDGEPYGGRGGALYNQGDTATVLFKRLALFKNNVGSLGGCALATRGTTEDDDDVEAPEGTNQVTFEFKAKFKDNSCDGEYLSIYDDRTFSDWLDANKGGGALLAYGATTVDFQNTAVFKRNEAPSGGAIVNSATISFVSDEKLFMSDNVDSGTCSDILNNDGATVEIGSETYVGTSPAICERS